MGRALEERGALTRRQITEEWEAHGLPGEGQAVPHLLRRASMEGIICFGPTVNGKATHVLLDSWLDDDLSQVADPGAELVRRYLSAYGSVTPEDYGTWSGLPVAEVRRGFASIEDELLKVEVDGTPMWMPRTRARLLDEVTADERPAIKMLGAFDPYLLGYRTRDLGVGPELLKRVHPARRCHQTDHSGRWASCCHLDAEACRTQAVDYREPVRGAFGRSASGHP